MWRPAIFARFPFNDAEARLVARLFDPRWLWLWLWLLHLRRRCLQLRLLLRCGDDARTALLLAHIAAAPVIAVVIVGAGPVLARLLRRRGQLLRLLWLGLQQRLTLLLLALRSTQVRAAFDATLLGAVAVETLFPIAVEPVFTIAVEAVLTTWWRFLALRTLQAGCQYRRRRHDRHVAHVLRRDACPAVHRNMAASAPLVAWQCSHAIAPAIVVAVAFMPALVGAMVPRQAALEV